MLCFTSSVLLFHNRDLYSEVLLHAIFLTFSSNLFI
uniref:Uncharacterized protein n=1 Tax=Arundo donax TaxID=35708 RepID=A0A0A9EHE3_ARUDO